MHHLFDDRRYLIPFRSKLLPQIFTDVLVIGGGVAGLRAALASSSAGDVECIVVAKGELKQSNTYWAQGGIAAVLDEADSVAEHVSDTLAAGAGLCDEPVVRGVVERGSEAVREVVGWGMEVDRVVGANPRRAPGLDELSGLALGMEGGHSRPRIVHSHGDATGRALSDVLVDRVRAADRVRVFERCFVLDLITGDGGEGGGEVMGAITHHPRYGLQVIWAGATVLASGGCGQVYRESTNPSVATGDGVAMAFRAGAELRDAEFVQFHPTTLYVAGASRALITEAVRGEGAYLIDRGGHRFMPDYDERAELAPRDVVSRAILAQMARTGHTHVYLDVRHLGAKRFAARFPGIAELLAKFDLDPSTQPIPVHPSAHYMIGGVAATVEGHTSLPGLFAAGEVTCTGLHGANRLASNSLLEGLVTGRAAGAACVAELNGQPRSPQRIVSDIPLSERSELDLADVRSSLRSVMWRHVGIEREGERLREVEEMFGFWARYTMDKIFDEQPGWEAQNLLTIGALITRAAAWRAESRGTHYRLDHPETREEFHVHSVWRRGREGAQTACVEAGLPPMDTDEHG